MKERTAESQSPDDTRSLGEAVGAVARPGDVILLSGELGAGKTLFVQGMALGMGFDGQVSSKSFVIMGEYPARETLYHADLYRLEDPMQVEELALGELTEDGVLAVEWPERGEWALPAEDIYVAFEVTGEDTRRLTFTAKTERGEALMAGVGGS